MPPLRLSDKGLEVWGWKKGREGVGKQERRKDRKLWPEREPWGCVMVNLVKSCWQPPSVPDSGEKRFREDCLWLEIPKPCLKISIRRVGNGVVPSSPYWTEAWNGRWDVGLQGGLPVAALPTYGPTPNPQGQTTCPFSLAAGRNYSKKTKFWAFRRDWHAETELSYLSLPLYSVKAHEVFILKSPFYRWRN